MVENKPKIRFKEFNKAWENKTIKNILDDTRGFVLPANKTFDIKTNYAKYPVFSSQTLNDGLLGFYDKYLYEDAITWTTDGANAGTVNFRKGKFYCTNVCGVLLSKKEKANKMIATAINNISKNHVSYVGNPKLMNGVMRNIDIMLPEENEQNKISNFIDFLDLIINKEEKNNGILTELKKTMLKKMFPQDNNNIPEIRFKGFEGEWQKEKLYKLTIWDKQFNEVEKFKQPKAIKYPYVLADKLVSLEDPKGDVLLLSTGTYKGYTTVSKAGKNLCKGEVVAIPWGGTANVKYCNGYFVTADNRIATSNDIEKLLNKFLYYIFNNKLVYIQNTYRGASIQHPNMSEILDMEILLPDTKEQKAICDYFDKIEILIEKQKEKINKLKNIRTTLLSKMFV